MSLFSGKGKSSACTGLFVGREGCALARISSIRSRKPRILATDFCTSSDGSQDPDTLDGMARSMDAAGDVLNVVLDVEEYQLLQVDAPEVDSDELRSAVRWRIKDLIDFHIDDAVIDVFAVPGQHNRPRGQAQMYAVAARAARVGALVDMLETTCLKLDVIDISELALRNLAALTEADARGMIMLFFDQNGGILTITRQHELYMTRRLEITSDELAISAEPLRAQVLLEVQRSIDYYGSHFSQPAPVALELLPCFDGCKAFADWLDGELDLDVGVFDLATHIEMEQALEGPAIALKMLAVGGALRREERAL